MQTVLLADTWATLEKQYAPKAYPTKQWLINQEVPPLK